MCAPEHISLGIWPNYGPWQTSEFGIYLSEALRYRLVCGLRNEAIRRRVRLLTEEDLTLEKAYSTAQGMEVAQLRAGELRAVRANETNSKHRLLALWREQPLPWLLLL